MKDELRTVHIGASLPAILVGLAKAEAKKQGISLSALIARVLADALKCEVPLPKRGGDFSSYKTKDTHARVAAKMRRAKRNKAERERLARLVRVIEEEALRKKSDDGESSIAAAS